MKRLNKSLMILLAFLFLSACEEKKDIIVRVGTSEITKEDFEIASIRKAVLLNKDVLNDEEKKELLDTMIKRELLVQYAKKEGIRLKEELIKAEIQKAYTPGMSMKEKGFLKREVKKNLYIDALRRSIAGNIQIKPEDIKMYYRKNFKEFREPDKYRIYLLQIKESDVPHLIEAFNKNPESFDKNALENVPPELKELNRQAPYSPLEGFPDEMIPFLKQAEKGKIYGPVKTPRGVFLFKLLDKKEGKIRPLSEVYHEIEHLLMEERIEARLSEIYTMLKQREKIGFR